MKSLIKLSLSVLAASVLAACSGGGSSSTSSTPPSANPPVNPPASPPVVPPVNSPAKSGVWASSSDQPAQITKVKDATAVNGLHILNIDGKDINLANTRESGINAPYYSIRRDVTYGRYNDPNKKDRDGQVVSYVFAYGNETAVDKIPTGGTFNYKGTATYGSQELYESGVPNGFVNGVDANFTVDFQAKTVDGAITKAANNINLTLPTAKIEGNGFKGNSGDAYLRGQFYGENASSIGGVFGDNGEGAYLGAFSATKQ